MRNAPFFRAAKPRMVLVLPNRKTSEVDRLDRFVNDRIGNDLIDISQCRYHLYPLFPIIDQPYIFKLCNEFIKLHSNHKSPPVSECLCPTKEFKMPPV